jgi:CheY-like chemotaxis protein
VRPAPVGTAPLARAAEVAAIMSPHKYILVIEDSTADFGLLCEALTEAGVACELRRMADGAEALLLAQETGQLSDLPVPALCLLDLHLPRVEGREILAALRRNPACRDMPIIVFSSFASPEVLQSIKKLDRVQYVEKGSDYYDWLALGREIGVLLRGLESRAASGSEAERDGNNAGETNGTTAAVVAGSFSVLHYLADSLLLAHSATQS